MKKITIEKVILFLAAGFAAYNFGMAGGYIEHGSGVHFSIGGLTAGIVVNVSLAIASSRYGSLNGKTRTRQATVAFITMLVISPLIVAPVVYYSLPGTFLGAWWLRAVYAMAYPLVADMAIVAMGAVSGKGLIQLSEPTAAKSDAGATDSAKGAKRVRRSASQSATESVGVRRTYPRKCEHCDAQVQSPNAVGAHMKRHHPELCKPKASLAEALFAGKAGEK